MRLPAVIPYNPRVKVFVLIFLGGVSLWILSFIFGFPPTLALFGSLIAGVFVVVLGIRRLLLKRCLTLRENDMTIPTGFLYLRNTTVAYAQLNQLREYPLRHMHTITFRNEKATLQLTSLLMPDDETYLEVCHFLAEHAGSPH